ncbi:MAG: hypothetical protein WC792_05120 [Candidatus Micrarchaeia archaeon]|jgi:hypothetical protein
MASYEEQASRQAYVEGRLLGLSQLISVLKEAMDAEENSGAPFLLKSIVMHISSEMDSILADLKREHGEHPAIMSAEKQVAAMSQAAAASKPGMQQAAAKKHVEAADDLMKNLLALREQEATQGEGE